MQTAVCYCQITTSFSAGETAARKVSERLEGQRPDFLFLFTSVGHDIPEIIRGVQSLYGEVPLCGCSGSGIISNEGCDELTHSLVLLAIRSKNLVFHPFIFSGLQKKPEQVGSAIAKFLRPALRRQGESRLLFLFTDGLTVNVNALNRGLEAGLENHLDIVGGTAGNDFQGQNTYQFCNGEVRTDSAAGVLVTGDFTYQIGVSHGSRPLGLFRTITKVDKNVILAIDEMPALDLLTDFIGKQRVKDFGHILNLFELGQQFPGRGYDEDILNRAIIGVDRERGGIRLAVEISEGSKVRMTRRDMHLVMERTAQMTRQLVGAMKKPGEAVYFYFNCSGRGSYLFGQPEPDVDVLRKELRGNKPLIGFFTFGEYAPVRGRNCFHNYTGILVGLE